MSPLTAYAQEQAQNEIKKLKFQHPAVAVARAQGYNLVVVPLGFFSDETSSNKSKKGNMHKSCSVNVFAMTFAT